MSGRPLIWSEYLYAYADGTPFQLLFGFGPESWAKSFDVYPHNTLISRSEEHTSEPQSLMRTSYAVFCLKKKQKRVILHLVQYGLAIGIEHVSTPVPTALHVRGVHR